MDGVFLTPQARDGRLLADSFEEVEVCCVAAASRRRCYKLAPACRLILISLARRLADYGRTGWQQPMATKRKLRLCQSRVAPGLVPI
jgi:hypothetical protein